jgi:ATP-dependent Lon protease
MVIITEQDIINTYNERQQEQCRLYYGYKRIKAENTSFGYKKIAKLMNQPYSKTRWWHAGKHIPVPIQTAKWLKEKGLLPLNKSHKDINKIAKIIGSTFGDGGIFENLNGIFLSSSELEATEEFGLDLAHIFGEEIKNNHRTIEGGEYGNSWCYQNTNRNVIRFFVALGSPLGKKTLKDLNIPKWIELNQIIKDNFYGALLGSEIGIPKIHKTGTRLDTFCFVVTSNKKRDKNRIEYLERLREFLTNKGIKVGDVIISFDKKKNHFKYGIYISTTLHNVNRFNSFIPIYYCKYKKEKLSTTLKHFWRIKRQRYYDLEKIGYKDEHIQTLLKINHRSLYIIKNPYDTFVP